ncbi:MAG: hypothetical protein IPO80_02305 [Propionibacteriaceae bacterium]|nr:hypothetical protein [Propionibacteriaceae bacterium]
MPGDEFGVYYQQELVQARVQKARSGLLRRLGSTLLSIGLIVAAWFGFPDAFAGMAPWLIGSTAAIGGVGAIYQLVLLLVARSDAAKVPGGLAVGLNREGVLVGTSWFPWGQVGALVVRPGRLGSSATLVATGRDNTSQRILLDYTDAKPAALDSAILALSGGRARVDLSRLDA